MSSDPCVICEKDCGGSHIAPRGPMRSDPAFGFPEWYRCERCKCSRPVTRLLKVGEKYRCKADDLSCSAEVKRLVDSKVP